ncbi:LysR-family transcriptional regulator [plant metagenome]|uniref:LysR-family transcriptional regulator n=1 Tax=plant metagenome TaxID=1297885 RepID=A0A484RAN1_9ZZZZ
MANNINLRHIEAFRAVMVSGSVVGAAELLSVTQPGVSRTIGLLELRLGYPLFQRKGRRLVPTSEAETLYREVEQLYGGIERLAQVAQDLRHRRTGALRVATMPALAQWVVPKVLAKFLEERPQVTVFVQSLPSRQIAELVSTRQFDLGVIELPLAHAGVHTEPLPSGDMVAVLPRQHRLADLPAIGLAALVSERLILPSQHSYVRYQIDDAFNQQGVAAHVIAESPTSTIAYALAAVGAGVALVSRWVPMPSRDPRCVVRPLKEAIHSQYGVITPSSQPGNALAGDFAQLLDRVMREP